MFKFIVKRVFVCALISASLLHCIYAQTRQGCPDLAKMRSKFIAGELFRPALLNGVWYEHAYFDIAQKWETCMCFNKQDRVKRGLGSKTGIDEQFGFSYGNIASHLNVFWEQKDDLPGVYTKYLKSSSPINTHFKLPSVILDVGFNGPNGKYTTILDYTCLDLGITVLKEVRFSTRERSLSPNELERAKDILREYNIDVEALKIVDHNDDCEYQCYDSEKM